MLYRGRIVEDGPVAHPFGRPIAVEGWLDAGVEEGAAAGDADPRKDEQSILERGLPEDADDGQKDVGRDAAAVRIPFNRACLSGGELENLAALVRVVGRRRLFVPAIDDRAEPHRVVRPSFCSV